MWHAEQFDDRKQIENKQIVPSLRNWILTLPDSAKKAKNKIKLILKILKYLIKLIP